MPARGTFAALALASLIALPTLASAAVVQKWKTANGVSYALISVGDLDGEGGYDLITSEPFGGGARVGVRSATTGALVAQSAAAYLPEDYWFWNVDGSGNTEIVFSDPSTGNLTCLAYTAGQGTLAVRWSYQPTPNGVPGKWQLVDFDGNGHYYLVFKDESGLNKKYYVRDHNGVLVTTLDLTTAPSGSGWNSDLFVDDYDVDGRQELMIEYHHNTLGDVLYVFESNAPAPGLAIAPGAGPSHSVGPRQGNAELEMRGARHAVRLR